MHKRLKLQGNLQTEDIIQALEIVVKQQQMTNGTNGTNGTSGTNGTTLVSQSESTGPTGTSSTCSTKDPMQIFERTMDTYGRLVFAYNRNDKQGSLYERGMLHRYSHNTSSTDITFFIPETTYIGSFMDNGTEIIPEGLVRMFKSVRHGQYLYFVGLMQNNQFVKGTLCNPDGSKKFQGTFRNNTFAEGILYHVNGTVKWKGSFLNGNPHGPGDYYSFNNRYIKGTMNNGSLEEGKMYDTSMILQYEGQFRNTDFHGLGIFYPEGQLKVPYERYIGHFQHDVPLFCLLEAVSVHGMVPLRMRMDGREIYKYAGSFTLHDKRILFHGMGAVFFRQPSFDGPTKLVKWVGKFHNGKRIGVFRIFETTSNDPLLSVSNIITGQYTTVPYTTIPDDYKFTNLESGILLGTTCFVNGYQMGSIEIFNDNKLVYNGAGNASITELVETTFIRDGQGTQFNSQGIPQYKGWYSMDELKIVEILYDEAGNKLFENNEDYVYSTMSEESFEDMNVSFMDPMTKRWPMISGNGSVFDTDGTLLYTAQFEHGILKSITNEVPVTDFAIEENKIVDYISLDQLRRGYYAYSFNGGEEFKQFISQASFNTFIEGPLKDPLRGAYPGYRFKKFRLV